MPRHPAFVGRDREASRFSTALREPGAVVLVEGEPGVGKSRLVAEWLDGRSAAQASSVAVGKCPPFSMPFTFAPLVSAVRSVVDEASTLPRVRTAGVLRGLLPEWAEGLPPSPEPLDSPEDERRRLLEAMAQLVTALPVSVLVLEDLHWADDATLDLLLLLLAQWPTRPSLVLTYRSEDVSSESALTRVLSYAARSPQALLLSLEPLDLPASEQMLCSMLGGEIDPSLGGYAFAETDGVPLLLQELACCMLDRGAIACPGSTWVRTEPAAGLVPTSVRDLARDRVERLSAGGREIAHAMAVLSEPADASDLAEIVSRDPMGVSDAIQECLRTGLLRDGEGTMVRFSHALIEQAVHDSIPMIERAHLHRAAGELLENRHARPTVLARHFREAGDIERWVHYGEEAARAAIATGDDSTAILVLKSLVPDELLPTRTRSRLAQQLGRAALYRASSQLQILDDVAPILMDVLNRPDLPERDQVVIAEYLSKILFQEGRTGESWRQLRRLLPSSSDAAAAENLSARAMAFLGWPTAGSWPKEVHVGWLKRAEAAAETLPGSQRLTLDVDRMTGLLSLGEPEGWALARDLPEHVSSRADRKTIVRAFVNLGFQSITWGRYQQARDYFHKAIRLADSETLERMHGNALCGLIHLDLMSGDWRLIESHADSRLQEADQIAQFEAMQARRLVEALRSTSTTPVIHAVSQLVEALDWTTSLEDMTFTTVGLLAQFQLRVGHVSEALDATSQAVVLTCARGIWLQSADVLAPHVEASCRAGRIDSAEALAADAVAASRATGAPALGATIEFVQGILARARGRIDDAHMSFTAAASRWQSMSRRREAALAEGQVGLCLADMGQLEEAGKHVYDAAAALREMGALADAAWVAELLSGGAVGSDEGPDHGERASLTPREAEAVGLLTSGLTDRAIAKRMGISTYTVVAHLASARRKLNARSRTELAVLAARSGVADPVSDGHGHRP